MPKMTVRVDVALSIDERRALASVFFGRDGPAGREQAGDWILAHVQQGLADLVDEHRARRARAIPDSPPAHLGTTQNSEVPTWLKRRIVK